MLVTEAISPDESDKIPLQQDLTEHLNPKRKGERARKKRSSSGASNTSSLGGDSRSQKALVADYVSDVSSEDFSGPEDGECESDGGGGGAAGGGVPARKQTAPVVNTSSPPPQQRRVVLPPEPVVARASSVPALIENASPIEEDDDDLDLSKTSSNSAFSPASPLNNWSYFLQTLKVNNI